jgi:tetratricopeptide (TPR) repeat protein
LAVPERNHYEVLGLSRSASPEDLHNHYLEKLHQVHPDMNAGDEEAAHERTIEVVNAYRTLSDPAARKLYDFRTGNPFLTEGLTPGLRVMLSKERKEAEARFNEGLRCLKVEDFTKAVEHFKAALKAEPAFGAASYNLALLGALLGNPNFALDVLAKAAQADPKDAALAKLRKAVHATFLSV